MADNGWRKGSLKHTADEINSRLGTNLVSDNAHHGANSLKQKMFPFYNECCILFGNDRATREEGNTGFDDMDTDTGDNIEETQGEGGLETTKTRTNNSCPKANRIVEGCFAFSSGYEPKLYLRSLDLLAVDGKLMEVFLGLEEDIKAAWLFRKLHQASL
ncbi:hypothetical protein IFM89_020379 [Coptis chinensis]|uniref:Uncharacterized protein n=1 Tax=Coptis chinensis TaxID=261450 RepID=A0A835HME6_9MAGN|nr:hypothetical protein IFM89_020379 [Coptis chinensis]